MVALRQPNSDVQLLVSWSYFVSLVDCLLDKPELADAFVFNYLIDFFLSDVFWISVLLGLNQITHTQLFFRLSFAFCFESIQVKPSKAFQAHFKDFDF
jgi:hypothetical protein